MQARLLYNIFLAIAWKEKITHSTRVRQDGIKDKKVQRNDKDTWLVDFFLAVPPTQGSIEICRYAHICSGCHFEDESIHNLGDQPRPSLLFNNLAILLEVESLVNLS